MGHFFITFIFLFTVPTGLDLTSSPPFTLWSVGPKPMYTRTLTHPPHFDTEDEAAFTAKTAHSADIQKQNHFLFFIFFLLFVVGWD
jgi:hypothetical protein